MTSPMNIDRPPQRVQKYICIHGIILCHKREKYAIFAEGYPDPDRKQNFDFHKNFEEQHRIWWASLICEA